MITNMHATPLSSSSTTITTSQHHSLLHKFTIITTVIILFTTQPTPSSSSSASSSLETFVYVGCSQQRYSPNTPYESNLNSILTSLVNSATSSTFNTFKISDQNQDDDRGALYGLYQCRGDLTASACRGCTAAAVAQIGRFCYGAAGGALQLLGCYVRYDSSPFLGVQDETVASSRCGPERSVGGGGDDDSATRRDAVLDYLMASGGAAGSGQYFRVGGSGRVQGMAQCVRDLSVGQCQECLGEATRRLKGACEGSSWGDVFLGKCYARFYSAAKSSNNGYFSDDGVRIRVNYSFLILVIYFLLYI